MTTFAILALGTSALLVLCGIVVPTIWLAIGARYFRVQSSQASRELKSAPEFLYDEFLDPIDDGLRVSP